MMSLQSNELNEGASATCVMCDDTGFKDYAGFALEPCDHVMGSRAQAIEAGTAKTAGLGPQGESAVPNGDAS